MTAILCVCSGRAGFRGLVDGTWVCADCGLPRPGYERTQVGNAYFRGGPMDGTAYSYDTLLSSAALTLPITEYRWTPEKITSKRTGNTARVWAWRDPMNADTPEPITSSPRTAESQENDMPKPAPTSQNTTSDGVTNTRLLERRIALGLSRPPVATAAGVTVAVLANMEVSGKRVKPGIMDAVHAALTRLENERRVAQGSHA